MSNNREQALRDVQHFGEEGGVVPVIDVAATSTFLNPADMERVFLGELAGCYLYSRHSNPTVSAFGQKLAALEGTEAALGLSSGMAAIVSTIEQLAGQGDHVVSARTVYGGTWAYFANLLPRRGVSVSFVDSESVDAIAAAIQPNTKVVYVETMSNPLLGVADLPAIGALCKARDIAFVVDNTFAPTLVTPAAHGADVVIHSCTKYISGGSDLISGAVCASRAFIDRLIDVNTGVVMLTGPVMDPRVAHELYLRLDHLPLRMRAHGAAALKFAQRAQQLGIKVAYPGLESHAHHGRFASIARPGNGAGGMVTLGLESPQVALALANRLQQEKFGLYAVSLGFSRTLMTCPAISTSSEIPAAMQAEMGLNAGLLRMSIGYTGDDEVLWQRFVDCWRQVRG